MTTTRPGEPQRPRPGPRRRIYHLMPAAQWDEQQHHDTVAADQLARHGFVHCCTREQIVEIASWWLKDDAPLVALEVDPDRLAHDTVRFERPEGERREYPHLYGPIPRAAILRAHPLAETTPGSFDLPATLTDPVPPGFTVEGNLDGRPVRLAWQAGTIVDGDDDLLRRVRERVDKGEPVKQFLHVTTTASLDSPYDAFSVVADVLDEVTAYRGDGFEDG